jgi:hypothetical protein
MATLKLWMGFPIPVEVNPTTNRRIVEKGHGIVTDPGDTGFDEVTLLEDYDAPYVAAFEEMTDPIALGVDNVLFTPLQFPEAA